MLLGFGNPARVIKYRFDTETIARLQRIKWWNLPQEEIEPLLLTYHNDMEGFLSHFDLPPQEAAQDETAAAIEQLRTQGYTVSYFIPDFEIPIPYCAWPRVIDSFLAAYTEQDRAALVLAMPEREDIHLYEEGIAARIRDYGDTDAAARCPFPSQHSSRRTSTSRHASPSAPAPWTMPPMRDLRSAMAWTTEGWSFRRFDNKQQNLRLLY